MCFLILAQYLYFKYSLYYTDERFTTINKSMPSNVLIPDPGKTEIFVFIPESFTKEVCHYIGPLTNIKLSAKNICVISHVKAHPVLFPSSEKILISSSTHLNFLLPRLL